MFHRPGRRLAAVLVALIAGALAVSAVALASPFSAPVLKKPGKNARVHAGKITLVVQDPGVPKDVQPVYVQISPKRKLDKNGFLARCLKVDRGCEFTSLKPWKGHPGMWKTTVDVSFPGYWAVTPGTYYWQANHVAPLCQAKGCEVVSKIGVFHVVK
jgi:hypothetical protein